MQLSRKTLVLVSVPVLLAFAAAVALFFQISPFEPIRSSLQQHLLDRLTYVRPPPADVDVETVYILGGTPKSLRGKFRVADRLYSEKGVENIWILSVTGLTKYSTKLGRNLTYDEWALERLGYYGIPPESVEAVIVEGSFLGTLSESRSVAALLRKRGLSSIIVISSAHHTHRVKICFEHFMTEEQTLYIAASEEYVPLNTLFLEYCKLKLYQMVLLFK